MAPKTMISKFPGTCSRCRGRFPAGTAIEWAKGVGATHANLAVCGVTASAPATPQLVPTIDLKPIADFLNAAKARGLKYPKARFLAPGGGELKLSLAGAGSKAPGSIQIVVRDIWVGRVETDGRVVGDSLLQNDVLGHYLLTIAGNPAEAAKAYGALLCRCSFCGLALADAGSVEVGYGPVCAKKWGLPHVPKGVPTLDQAVAS